MRNILYFLCLLLIIGCGGDTKSQISPNQIQGHVILENQTDHSGTVVYLNGSEVSAVTDEEGFYSLSLHDTINIDGSYPLYFYHAYYEIDSFVVDIEGNDIIINTQDEGNSQTLVDIELEQLINLSMSFNQNQVVEFDTLLGDLFITNLSDSTIILGTRSDQPSTDVRDWVLYNILGGDSSFYYFEESCIDRGYDTLNTMETLYVTTWLALCVEGTPSPPCIPGYHTIKAGEYYYIPAIFAVIGYYNISKIPFGLKSHLIHNYNGVIDEIIVPEPGIIFNKFSFPKLIVSGGNL